MHTVIWFREDLRITDNTALYHAAHQAEDGVIAIYLVTPKTWEQHHMAACRVNFLFRNLESLRLSLNELNIPLAILTAQSDQAIPKLLLKFLEQHNAQMLFFNKQYEFDEKKRDTEVTQLLEKNSIKVCSYDDQVVFAPGSILTQQDKFYTVYTPFKKAWLKKFHEQELKLLPKLKPQKKISLQIETKIPIKDSFNNSTIINLWQAGETHAQNVLKNFTKERLFHYHVKRDYPAIAGTSQLSPYLAAGILSPRQCLKAALAAREAHSEPNKKATETWINELVWREFYKHIVYAMPRVCMYKPVKLITEKLNWNHNPEHLQAWQQGQTGFPIIDAAMRQLHETGWMHNRLRMLTATFLSKLLFIDWRLGERYFMENLIDGDFAANNGGWQWCASTGTDAVPYFRIFNPLLQSQKFDPQGDFIRRYCPELSTLDKKMIHNPYQFAPKLAIKTGYPKPIINYANARIQVLTAFKALKA